MQDRVGPSHSWPVRDGDAVECRQAGLQLFLVLTRRDGYRISLAIDSKDNVQRLLTDLFRQLLATDGPAARALIDHLTKEGGANG